MFQVEGLVKALNTLAPIQTEKGDEFKWYDVCNERHWTAIYQDLMSAPPADTKNGVAIHFGESNFISLLPQFEKMGISLVCQADIDWRLHLTTRTMLNAFRQANDLETFEKIFIQSSTEKYDWAPTCRSLQSRTLPAESGPYHFLASQQRYDECKAALKNITICQIRFDLRLWRLSSAIAGLINQAGADIRFLNISNIHSPDYDPDVALRTSIPKLLEYSPHAKIIAADLDDRPMAAHAFNYADFTQVYKDVVVGNAYYRRGPWTDIKAVKLLRSAMKSFEIQDDGDLNAKIIALEDAIMFYHNIYEGMTGLKQEQEPEKFFKEAKLMLDNKISSAVSGSALSLSQHQPNSNLVASNAITHSATNRPPV
ncbi:MAG: hypothetical protein ACHQAX_02380 [Gammaproteobacteria bacterium]